MFNITISDTRLHDDFGTSFVSAWKTTHNFHVWSESSHPAIMSIPPGLVLFDYDPFFQKLDINSTFIWIPDGKGDQSGRE